MFYSYAAIILTWPQALSLLRGAQILLIWTRKAQLIGPKTELSFQSPRGAEGNRIVFTTECISPYIDFQRSWNPRKVAHINSCNLVFQNSQTELKIWFSKKFLHFKRHTNAKSCEIHKNQPHLIQGGPSCYCCCILLHYPRQLPKLNSFPSAGCRHLALFEALQRPVLRTFGWSNDLQNLRCWAEKSGHFLLQSTNNFRHSDVVPHVMWLTKTKVNCKVLFCCSKSKAWVRSK